MDHRARLFIVLGLCALALLPVSPPLSAQPVATRARGEAERRILARSVRTWMVQYRHIDVAEIAAADVDLAVIDFRPDPLFGTEWPFDRPDVQRMQARPGGRKKLLLAYMSIGEAEDYRWYWQRAWSDKAARPSWIADENTRWPGNFPVAFNAPAWRSILFGRAESYLDRIIAAGFDGVYLDRADVYQEMPADQGHEAAMAGLVREISTYAHARNPRFLVVLQNAEELTRRADVRQAIDMLAKEDLYYGIDHDGRRNSPDAVAAALRQLRFLRTNGIPVLLIEYPHGPGASAVIRQRASSEGFPLALADRALDRLPNQAGSRK